MTEDRDILTRARGYPYDYPRTSFLFRDGDIQPFDPAATEGRTPVLAFGSNQAPEQLQRKFALVPGAIPVERARLTDFDVVYSAHITAYGAVPAMLQHCPGAQVDVGITWLTDVQLQVMHQTELHAANYAFAALDDVDLTLERGQRHGTVYAYIGERGHLARDGLPVSLLAVHCDGRRWPARSTGEMLEIVRERIDPASDPDAFVLRLVRDKSYRRRVSHMLGDRDGTFAYPFRVIKTG